jgi:DNA repair protein RecO
MEKKRDLAIVLRSLPYEERHRIVTALTQENGQISAIAHNGIQSRRFGGTLEVFAAGEWNLTRKPGSELYRVDETRILRPYDGLRKDFERLSLASALNELMLRLAPKEESCPDLFRLHSNALAFLDEFTDTPEAPPAQQPARSYLAILNAYLAKLLQWSGSQPRILECLSCSTDVRNLPYDSPDSGEDEEILSCVIPDAGWICARCRAAGSRHVQSDRHSLRHNDAHPSSVQMTLLKISPRAVVDFHSGMALPIRQAPLAAQATLDEQKELFRFLEALFIYHVPGFDKTPLKSLRFLGLESSLQPLPANPR